MRYDEWFAHFIKDKTELPEVDQATTHAAHSIKRYRSADATLWEIGFTYTDRLIVRTGTLLNDGLTIAWGNWLTRHDVQLRQPQKCSE